MAQLDSASDSDSDGWRFESVWVRHFKTFAFCKGLFLLTKRIQYLLLTRLTLRVTIAITFALLATSPPICTFRLWTLHKSLLRSLCSLQVRLGVPSRHTQKERIKLRRVCLFLCKTGVNYRFCGNLPFLLFLRSSP